MGGLGSKQFGLEVLVPYEPRHVVPQCTKTIRLIVQFGMSDKSFIKNFFYFEKKN